MSETSLVIQQFISSQFWLALVICLAVIPILTRPAKKMGLVDRPGGRKQHNEAVPLVGGPAIFFATSISIAVWGLPVEFYGMLFATAGLFLIGFFDDKYDIKAGFKLTAQALLVAAALWLDNIWVSQIHVTSDLIISLGAAKYPLTVFAIMGIINAINMLDGLDGLASGVAMIILAFLVSISVLAETPQIALIGTCLLGAVLGFWAYNYRFSWRNRAKVFLGDSGATLLGFIIAYLGLKLSIMKPQQMPISVLLWVFAIPVWDIFAVIVKRIRTGQSPLRAGREHIHYVLMRSGLSPKSAIHLIYLLTLATVTFGLLIRYFGLVSLEILSLYFVFMLVYLKRVGVFSKLSAAKTSDNIDIKIDIKGTAHSDTTVVLMKKKH